MAKKHLPIERLAYSVEDGAAAIGVGKDMLYDAINSGQIIPKQFGTRTLIPADRLKAFFDAMPDLTQVRPSRPVEARKRKAKAKRQAVAA